MKTRWLLMMVTMLSLFSLLIPAASFAEGGEVALNDGVSQADAQNVASYGVTRYAKDGILPGWERASISFTPTVYYSLDHSKAAYEFTVLKDGQDAGFIIVAARKDWNPILEFGDGKAPSSDLSAARQSAIEKGYITGLDNVEPRLYYGGAFSYTVQFGEKMINDKVVIDLLDGSIRQLVGEQKHLQMENTNTREAWDEMSLDPGTGFSILTYEQHTISGVPAYWQSYWAPTEGCDSGNDANAYYPACVGIYNDPWYNWDGCSPISGAMVMGYWRTQGYSTISSDDDALVDRCHYAMYTTNDGATYTQYYTNLSLVFNLYGYDNFTAGNIHNAYWSDMRSQVNLDRPPMLHVWSNSTYGTHSVCVTGYYSDDYCAYVTVHDARDASQHSISWWDWTDQYLTWVSP